MTNANPSRRLSVTIREILRNRDYRYLWLSGGVENTCRWMDVVVMGLLVLRQTDSPWQVALLFAARWIPMLLFSMLSGMIADRANRWLVMAIVRSSAVAVTVVVLALVITDAVRPWHLLVASFILGWTFVLDFPSRRSLIYDMVGGERIVSAMSLETISMTIGRFIGPFTAGFLIEASGFTGAYIVLLCGYTVSLLLLVQIQSRIPARSVEPRPFLSNLARGIRYSLQNRVIRGVLAITLIMNALAFSSESLFPVVARDHLNVGEGLTGVLISAQSIGTLTAALIIAAISTSQNQGRIFCAGITLQLSGLLLFALSPWYPLSYFMLLFAGLGAAGFSTMQSTIILISATPDMRGTALGVLGQCIGVAALGGLAVGALASYLDARTAIAINAILGLVLLLPVITFSPLAWRPITSPE